MEYLQIDPIVWARQNQILSSKEEILELLKEASILTKIVLSHRQLCDIELILNGGFAPLKGFMNKEEYDGVVLDMRLPSGSLFPIPITLDISELQANSFSLGDRVSLLDDEGNTVAIMTLESIWKPDKELEAKMVFKTLDRYHPAVAYLMEQAGTYYMGGRLQGLKLPPHYDYQELRKTPFQLRKFFREQNFQSVVGFQTRNPLHRSHFEMIRRAAESTKGIVLLHPSVGMTKPGDIDHFTRVKCYLSLIQEFKNSEAYLSLLPLAMRMGGPREAIWHAIIRRNYGCTHFIIGRDHAGPGNGSDGKPFYGDYEAQELALQYEKELGIKLLTFKQIVYVAEIQEYMQEHEVENGKIIWNISGTELRRRLMNGEEIPEWFSFPKVIKILQTTYKPRQHLGFTILFTGLSGSGKSTLANALLEKLMELTSRSITLLDGDEIRKVLSTELTFSREHRKLNVQRVGYVASEISKAGGIAIMALIAPYEEDRKWVKKIVTQRGGFVEIYMSTPLETCAKRDRKGLYKKAREGILKGFTGIDDPYEAPSSPDLELDATNLSVEECLDMLINTIKMHGYL